MKRFACGDVVPGCDARFHGDDDEVILGQVALHAASDHGLPTVDEPLVQAVLAAIRTD